MRNKNITPWVIVVVLGLFVIANSVYIVKEWETGIRFRFGKIVQNTVEPGLNFKLPFLDNVKKYDTRIQTLKTEPERFLTLEKKNLIVDTFVKWKVVDGQTFYQRVQGSPARLNNLLFPIIQNNYRAEFGRRNLQEVVAGIVPNSNQTVRTYIQQKIFDQVQEEAKKAGVEIVDVRIKGIELPRDVLDSVFERMRTERERVAKEFRASGESAYIKKVAEADRARDVKLADAYSEAEKIRGEGDAEAADIYANAYGKNRDFYQFNRSLEAYRNSIKSQGDVLILDTNTDFFKYFQPK